MSDPDVRPEKQAVEGRFGPWTSHNIALTEDVYTMERGVVAGSEVRLRQIVQLVCDISPKPVAELRILDLGALEGLFALEFARRGARVVAVEGREANLEKMRFAQTSLRLDDLELHLEDVRALSRDRFGEFDVVLCLGLLYHLDAPDVFGLLQRIRDVCRMCAIVETRVHRFGTARREFRGRSYFGVVGLEPPPDTPALSRTALWSSIGNPRSFELTRASLCNALVDSGFSSVLECHEPPHLTDEPRGTFVALAGSPQAMVVAPQVNSYPLGRLEEEHEPLTAAVRRHPAYRMLISLIPASAKRALKSMLSRLRST
jgi:SAM-dependent methyltransferase